MQEKTPVSPGHFPDLADVFLSHCPGIPGHQKMHLIGIEPTHAAPEATALSTELQTHLLYHTRIVPILQVFFKFFRISKNPLVTTPYKTKHYIPTFSAGSPQSPKPLLIYAFSIPPGTDQSQNAHRSEPSPAYRRDRQP